MTIVAWIVGTAGIAFLANEVVTKGRAAAATLRTCIAAGPEPAADPRQREAV
ncbi:hypothetical protein [Mycobacterium sp. MS1601]|uniref:hypothetical protein n=1 Tax=Mycobacterium sp. MS1601 TaxID=1936029 RepID=UPI0012FC92C8|nr:hypothetical protein [Mycobacterium sp. MS1601]